VGLPLPGVEVRLADGAGLPVEAGTPGEIEVRGPTVFLEYWQRPDETARAFRHGWFRTGDSAVVENGRYRILGRANVDIIKTGGYKVSALEIEEVLLEHPHVRECCVLGIPDAEWGERVGVAVWARQRLAPYKVPTRLRIVTELPRNEMGKVQKPRVAELFAAAQ
jgi:malonyl-CoA/methylmalonyl-CoA synthetase